MKFNRVFFLVFVGLLSVLLTACGAAPQANWPGMTSDGKNVYMADGQVVYTVQVSNGQELTTPTADGPVPMRFPLKTDGNVSIYGAPALTSDGQMIFGNASTLTNDHTLYSIDPATGNVKWTFADAKGAWIAGAVVGADTIYAAAGDGKVYAVDFKGKKRWDISVSDHALWTSPITDGKLVYVATLAHDVIALDPATGKQRWKKTLDNAIIGAPAISADGVLYVGTISGNLYAINAAEGSQVWLTQLKGGIWSTPVLDGSTLYVGTSDGTAGKFYAVNTADGKLLRNPVEETGAIIASPLITKDQVIYVTEDGFINFFDKNGARSIPVIKIENAKLYTTPILVGDLILIAPMNAPFMLAAYNQKGVQQWAFVPK
jgi:outer membrane protein assembly factor BamB